MESVAAFNSEAKRGVLGNVDSATESGTARMFVASRPLEAVQSR